MFEKEIYYKKSEDIKELLTDFDHVEIIKDYENIDRIVKAVLCSKNQTKCQKDTTS